MWNVCHRELLELLWTKIVDIYESLWCCEELRKKFEYSIFKLGLSWIKRLLPSGLSIKWRIKFDERVRGFEFPRPT